MLQPEGGAPGAKQLRVSPSAPAAADAVAKVTGPRPAHDLHQPAGPAMGPGKARAGGGQPGAAGGEAKLFHKLTHDVLALQLWPHLSPWARAQLRATCRQLRELADASFCLAPSSLTAVLTLRDLIEADSNPTGAVACLCSALRKAKAVVQLALHISEERVPQVGPSASAAAAAAAAGAGALSQPGSPHAPHLLQPGSPRSHGFYGSPRRACPTDSSSSDTDGGGSSSSGGSGSRLGRFRRRSSAWSCSTGLAGSGSSGCHSGGGSAQLLAGVLRRLWEAAPQRIQRLEIHFQRSLFEWAPCLVEALGAAGSQLTWLELHATGRDAIAWGAPDAWAAAVRSLPPGLQHLSARFRLTCDNEVWDALHSCFLQPLLHHCGHSLVSFELSCEDERGHVAPMAALHLPPSTPNLTLLSVPEFQRTLELGQQAEALLSRLSCLCTRAARLSQIAEGGARHSLRRLHIESRFGETTSEMWAAISQLRALEELHLDADLLVQMMEATQHQRRLSGGGGAAAPLADPWAVPVPAAGPHELPGAAAGAVSAAPQAPSSSASGPLSRLKVLQVGGALRPGVLWQLLSEGWVEPGCCLRMTGYLAPPYPATLAYAFWMHKLAQDARAVRSHPGGLTWRWLDSFGVVRFEVPGALAVRGGVGELPEGLDGAGGQDRAEGEGGGNGSSSGSRGMALPRLVFARAHGASADPLVLERFMACVCELEVLGLSCRSAPFLHAFTAAAPGLVARGRLGRLKEVLLLGADDGRGGVGAVETCLGPLAQVLVPQGVALKLVPDLGVPGSSQVHQYTQLVARVRAQLWEGTSGSAGAGAGSGLVGSRVDPSLVQLVLGSGSCGV